MKTNFFGNLPEKPTMDVNRMASFFTQMIAKVHYCHHNTTSFAQHKATDKFYDALVDLKDEMLEKAIGYTGIRYTKVTLQDVEGAVDTMLYSLCEETCGFVDELKSWADMNMYHDLCNLADTLSGEAAKFKYLLTLK